MQFLPLSSLVSVAAVSRDSAAAGFSTLTFAWSRTVHTPHDLYRAACAADDAWMREIVRTLKGRSGDLRYTPAAQGQPGSPLNQRFTEWRAAMDAYLATFGSRA